MSVTTENAPVQGQTTLQENRAGEGVYASLFEKINLAPASRLGDINDFLDDAALSEAPAAERLTAAMQVFMERIRQSGQRVEKLDKTLIDRHIAELDFQISRQLDAVMHHQEFQQVESLWRGLKQLVDNTDYRQNVKTEILDVSKDDLRQDFEDSPELIQSGLYWHTYISEYDTPGGEPVAAVLVDEERLGHPQGDPADLVEPERGGLLVAVQIVDVEAVLQFLDDRLGRARGVLDDVVPARLERRVVGHPAHGGVEFLRGVRLVVYPGDHVATRDVDVVGQADRDRHGRDGLLEPTGGPVDCGDGAGLSRWENDDFITGAHDATGDGARVAAVVGVLVGLRPDHVLDREADVHEVAIAGHIHGLQQVEQRPAGIPGHVVAGSDDV